MIAVLAHIVEFDPPPGYELTTGRVVSAAIVAFVIGLTIEHLFVKHGADAVRHLRRWVAIAVFGFVVIAFAPAPATGQDREIPAGLPDLVSEPPIIWFDKVVEYPDGSQRKVIAFDGYLHNIGDGMLDLAGNPQVEGGVQQRVWDGEQWNDVGEPRVIYEVTDGHNHFHLMAASEYSLWDEAQVDKIGDSAKVGFCLVDTELAEDRYEMFYDINDPDLLYCQQYNPEATELRMGLTPGWVDTYDANTTLQWVDVSRVAPGRYWVGAIMDPDDQIVESDEDNNALTWSTTTFAVTGHTARDLEPQLAGEPIRLKSDAYGQVGDRMWQITEGPGHGRLSFPVGVDFGAETITYVPDPGFSGSDSFSYIAIDVDDPYPLDPHVVTVEVDASAYVAGGDGDGGDGPAGLGGDLAAASIIVAGPLALVQYEPVDRVAELIGVVDDAEVRWFADNLPAGVRIDQESGALSGLSTVLAQGVATIVARVEADRVEAAEIRTELAWSIEPGERPAMESVADFNVPYQQITLRMSFGEGSQGAVYAATGLPEGLRVTDNRPLLTGTPGQVGVFDVEVTETVDDVETGGIDFTITVRPTPRPAFPL